MRRLVCSVILLILAISTILTTNALAQDPLTDSNLLNQYVDDFQADSMSKSLDYFGIGLVMLSIGAFLMAASIHFLYDLKEDLNNEILSLQTEIENTEVIRKDVYETVPTSVEEIKNLEEQLEVLASKTPHEEVFDYLLKEVS